MKSAGLLSAFLASATTLAGSLPSSPVAASGPVEMLVGVYVDPPNPQRFIVRYDNTGSKTGLLYSDDAGANFSLVCTTAAAASALRALDAPSSDVQNDTRSGLSRNRMAHVTSDGRTVLGTTSGLYIDDGKGCSFRAVNELLGIWISGVAPGPGTPGVSYVLTGGSSDAAGEGLWQRAADGSFTKLSERGVPAENQVWSSPGLIATPLPGGGTRLFATSQRFEIDSMGLKTFLMRTDDGGITWHDHEITDLPERASFTLLAVDPTDEERVVAMFERSKQGGDWESNKDTVLLSSDGGATFEPYFEGAAVSGTMFLPDGTLWISDLGLGNGEPGPTGLYKAAPGLANPPEHVITDQAIGCLGKAPTGDDLLLCRLLDFGRFNPTTKEYTELMSMTTVQEIRSCSDQDMVADCRDQLCDPGWCGPGHFASAPLCSAYDERFCGNDADNWNRRDAGVDGGDSPIDGGVDVDSGTDEVVTRRKEDCSVHPGNVDRWLSPTGCLALLAAAVLGLRRRFALARSEGRKPWKGTGT